MRTPPPPRLIVLATIGSVLLAMHPARSLAACPGSDAGKSCDGGSGADNCTFTSTTVTCDLADAGGSQGAVGNFFNSSNTAFRAFGTDSKGELFCCEYTGLVDACNDYTTPIAETITGTGWADTLKLQYSTLDLKCATPSVYGGSGNDDIQGSRTNAVNYLEVLFGQAGADTIRGESGVDEIHGGDGADIIWGGDDDDTIYGDAGVDHIKGDDGDDYIDAGADNDQACGGAGKDTIFGGSGGDILFDGIGTVAAQSVTGDLGADVCGDTTYATVSCDDPTHTSCPW